MLKKNLIRIAVDGNEANIFNRVGSNVYAFEILKQISQLTQKTNSQFDFTILLSRPPIKDWPQATAHWRYQVVKPRFFWT